MYLDYERTTPTYVNDCARIYSNVVTPCQQLLASFNSVRIFKRRTPSQIETTPPAHQHL